MSSQGYPPSSSSVGERNQSFCEWIQDNKLPPEARQLFPRGLTIRTLRQNPLTKRWTLYGQQKSGTALKPRGYNTVQRADPRALEQPEVDTSGRDPFAAGTEAKNTSAELCRILPSGELIEQEGLPETDVEHWLARAVRNTFPYFATPSGVYTTPFPGEGSALVRGELDNVYTNPWHNHPFYAQKDAFGASEVIIETPKYNGQMAVMPGEQTFHALRVLAARGRALRGHSEVQQLAYFKQYGSSAGGSLVHPHMQVHALPILTGKTSALLKQHLDFFKAHNCCAVERLYVTDVTAADSPGETRLVRETDHFVASVPYAAYHKGRIVIAPKRHMQRFEDSTDDELSDLGNLLQLVMAAVYRRWDDPHYNLFWETLPTPQGLTDVPEHDHLGTCFRWTLHVRAVRNLLGITNASGVEFAMYLPEQVAQEYRELIEEELRAPLRDQPRMSERDFLAQQLAVKEKEVAELKLKMEKDF